MKSAIESLLSISSASLAAAPSDDAGRTLHGFGRLGRELFELLEAKNGFYAFESSLHVLPIAAVTAPMTVQAWNAPPLWRCEYASLIPGNALFFAEDAFGDQFCLKGDEVSAFRSESAEFVALARSVPDWVAAVMSDWRNLSGYPLAHDWQIANRALAEGERLIPKTPFVIGGAYEVENLYAGNVVEAMRFRGSLARQIADLPDGTAVSLKIT